MTPKPNRTSRSKRKPKQPAVSSNRVTSALRRLTSLGYGEFLHWPDDGAATDVTRDVRIVLDDNLRKV